MNEARHKTVKHMLLSLPVVLLLVGIDHLTKYWANHNLRGNGPIPLIKGVFSLTWTQNSGAAWGMLGGQAILNWLPIIIGIIIVVVYWRIPMTKRMLPLNIVLLMLFSGAIGNRIDRSVYGGVQDFLYFELIDFPIFNIADCYIVISCIAAAFLLIFYYKDEKEFEGMFRFRRKK